MSFSFGATSAPFGTAAPASTPGFGAASAPAFGAASTPAFGAAATPAFGAASAPPFGAPATSSSAPASGFSFGGQSSAGFGASTSAPAFGASTPAFSFGGAAPASSASTFGFGTAGALVPAASAPAFSGFGAPAASAAPAAAPLSQPGGIGGPAQQPITLATKFEELPPQAQQFLSQVQQQISQYEKERQAVSRLPHLAQEPSGDLAQETQGLLGELRGLQGAIRAEHGSLADFRNRAVELLQACESIVRTFQRTKLWREAPNLYSKNPMGVPPQVQELLAQPVLLPAPFLEEAVQGFKEKVEQYKRVVADLEQACAISGGSSDPVDINLLQALPTIIGNLHDYFVHVAAKMEKQHDQIQRLKSAYLASRQARGELGDPFERLRKQQPLLQGPGGNGSIAAGSKAGGAGGGAALGGFGAAAQAGMGGTPGGAGAAAAGATAGALVPVAGGAPSPTAGGSPFLGGSSPAAAGVPPGTMPFGSPFPGTPAAGGGFNFTPVPANGALGRTPSSKQPRSKSYRR